ncbi:MAG TPA: GvpL/GvpF family gas vesicle protein [Thermoleophilaceae bacterium]|nr:GvpL/GvpF family gas vesicle protein [Thermoleophilaceae bacterium]
MADDLAGWARKRAPELLARAEAEAVAALRDALVDAAIARRGTEAKPKPRPQAPPARVEGPAGEGIWAYCVSQAGEPVPEGAAGVDGGALKQVEAGGLAALVSPVPLAEFGAGPLRDNLNDLAWLERVAREHETVLEGVLSESTIVPLRLCTIYTSEDNVRDMLEEEHDSLARAIEVLAGRQEWGAKVLADDERLAEEARSRSAETAALEDELSARTGGGAYMLRRRLERHIRDAVDALGTELAEQVHAQLQDWASDAVVLAPQNPELSGHEGRMLLNGAYLVEAKRVDGLRELVAELEERHSALGVSIQLTGPWPPYNFVPGGATALA